MEAADINVLIFRETLIKYLGSRKEKNKEKLKWLGTLIDFKAFTKLLLGEKGKWKTRAQAGYEVHSFEQDKKRFSITWWTSSKTFIIRGEDKYRDKILRKIQDLLKSKVNEKTNERTVKTDTPKRKGRKRKGKSPVFETVVEGTKDDRIKQVIREELQKVWAAITEINAKICKKTTEEDSDKEFTDDNETISITISNKFQSLNGINEPSTSIQRTAEIKRLATMEPDEKKIENELFEERRKVHDLENAMKETEKFISDLNAENETIRERNTRLEQELQLVMKQLADLKCEKSRANENQAENAEADNKKPYSKPKVILAGDSIVRNIHGWMMSRNKSVKVNSFPELLQKTW